jgi:hypothetical protein
MTETISNANAAASTLFLGHNGEWWDFWLIISVIAAAFVATAIGVTTAGSIISHKREARSAELTVDAKVADAKKEGIEAGKTAGDALVKAATLEKEAANIRLEAEKLKAQIAWREIKPEIAQKLESELAKNPGSVNLRYTDGDPEALMLAIQFSNILNKAHWQIAPGALKFSNSIFFGIALPDSGNANALNLRNALTAAGIVPFSTDPLPPTVAEFSVTTIPGAPVLMIGSKLAEKP